MVDVPLNELGYPRVWVRVTGAYNARRYAVCRTVTHGEHLELLVAHLRHLVNGNVGILLTLVSVVEVGKLHVVIGERQPASCIKVPCQVVLGAIEGAVFIVQLMAGVYDVGQVIQILTEDDGAEVRIGDVVQGVHQQNVALSATARTTHNADVSLRRQHVSLTFCLCCNDFVVRMLA